MRYPIPVRYRPFITTLFLQSSGIKVRQISVPGIQVAVEMDVAGLLDMDRHEVVQAIHGSWYLGLVAIRRRSFFIVKTLDCKGNQHRTKPFSINRETLPAEMYLSRSFRFMEPLLKERPISS